LVRRGQLSAVADPDRGSQTGALVPVARQGHALRGRADGRRAWWTRERVLAGLVAYRAATGRSPTTSRHWAGLVRSLGALSQHLRRYPSEYAVLRHFPSFRAAWEAA